MRIHADPKLLHDAYQTLFRSPNEAMRLAARIVLADLVDFARNDPVAHGPQLVSGFHPSQLCDTNEVLHFTGRKAMLGRIAYWSEMTETDLARILSDARVEGYREPT